MNDPLPWEDEHVGYRFRLTGDAFCRLCSYDWPCPTARGADYKRPRMWSQPAFNVLSNAIYGLPDRNRDDARAALAYIADQMGLEP